MRKALGDSPGFPCAQRGSRMTSGLAEGQGSCFPPSSLPGCLLVSHCPCIWTCTGQLIQKGDKERKCLWGTLKPTPHPKAPQPFHAAPQAGPGCGAPAGRAARSRAATDPWSLGLGPHPLLDGPHPGPTQLLQDRTLRASCLPSGGGALGDVSSREIS